MVLRLICAAIIAAVTISRLLAAEVEPNGRLPLFDGGVQEVGLRLSAKPGVPGSRIGVINGTPTARSIRLQIVSHGEIDLTSDLSVIIYSSNGSEVIRYLPKQFTDHREIWTPEIKGSMARVELSGKSENGFWVSVSAIAFHVPPAKPTLNVVRDFDFEDIETIKVNQPEIFAASRSVAKISLIIRPNSGPCNDSNPSDCVPSACTGSVGGCVTAVCTGFLIGQNHMLTNYHCIPSDEVCESASIIFGYHNSSSPLGEEANSCLRVAASDKKLDATVIEVAGSPGDRWGFLAFSDSEPAVSAPAVVVQHPGGFAKMVSRKDCVVSTMPADGIAPGIDFGHTCDTMEGSSGSPVLGRKDLKVIGLHHWGFDQRSQRWNGENRAVQIRRIKEKLKY